MRNGASKTEWVLDKIVVIKPQKTSLTWHFYKAQSFPTQAIQV